MGSLSANCTARVVGVLSTYRIAGLPQFETQISIWSDAKAARNTQAIENYAYPAVVERLHSLSAPVKIMTD
jgi:hypothetical protein